MTDFLLSQRSPVPSTPDKIVIYNHRPSPNSLILSSERDVLPSHCGHPNRKDQLMSVKKVTDLGAPHLGELGLTLVDVRGLQLACGPEQQDMSLKTDREAPGARSRFTSTGTNFASTSRTTSRYDSSAYDTERGLPWHRPAQLGQTLAELGAVSASTSPPYASPRFRVPGTVIRDPTSREPHRQPGFQVQVRRS
jgi:hypothetical protein